MECFWWMPWAGCSLQAPDGMCSNCAFNSVVLEVFSSGGAAECLAQASCAVGSLACGRTGPSHRSLAASSTHKCKAAVSDLPFIPLGFAAA